MRLLDGVCSVNRHTTCPDEFCALWEALGRPAREEREAEGIPFVRFAVDGVGWRLTVNLMARTLSDMHLRLDAA